MFLEKDKLNAIKVLTSKALMDSYISHDEFFLVNNLLKEYNEMKEEIKYPETSAEYTKKSRKMHEKNDIETIVDNDGTLSFNEKHIEKELYHKNL